MTSPGRALPAALMLGALNRGKVPLGARGRFSELLAQPPLRAAGVVVRVFNRLVGNASPYAIDKLRSEWNSIFYDVADQDAIGLCGCEILHRCSLPCMQVSGSYET